MNDNRLNRNKLIRLLLSKNSISNDSKLINLTDINLAHNGITSIDKDAFNNLTNLTSIILFGNKITSIEKDTFNNLTNLTQINLSDNKIISIDKDAFNGLTNFTQINLSHNRITSIDKDTFNNSTNLTQINLCGNEIRSIDEDAFNGLTNLTDIDLSSNEITSIDKDAFNGLTNLTSINFSFNEITSINQDTFNNLTYLNQINLSDNKIISINKETFNNLTNLTDIDLSFNEIASIDKDSFNGLTNLTSIILFGNKITSIDKDTFNNLTNLTQINLSDNKIMSINTDAFNGLTNLTDIDLSSNEITSIDKDAFNGLTNLIQINLSHSRITSIDKDSFNGLTNLHYINLSFNEITSISKDAFNNLTNLTQINLSDNKIISINKETFNNLSNLTDIDLSFNEITSIDKDAFNNLTYLNQINLSHNRITSIDKDAFNGITNLTDIYLSFNEGLVTLTPNLSQPSLALATQTQPPLALATQAQPVTLPQASSSTLSNKSDTLFNFNKIAGLSSNNPFISVANLIPQKKPDSNQPSLNAALNLPLASASTSSINDQSSPLNSNNPQQSNNIFGVKTGMLYKIDPKTLFKSTIYSVDNVHHVISEADNKNDNIPFNIDPSTIFNNLNWQTSLKERNDKIDKAIQQKLDEMKKPTEQRNYNLLPNQDSEEWYDIRYWNRESWEIYIFGSGLVHFKNDIIQRHNEISRCTGVKQENILKSQPIQDYVQNQLYYKISLKYLNDFVKTLNPWPADAFKNGIRCTRAPIDFLKPTILEVDRNANLKSTEAKQAIINLEKYWSIENIKRVQFKNFKNPKLPEVILSKLSCQFVKLSLLSKALKTGIQFDLTNSTHFVTFGNIKLLTVCIRCGEKSCNERTCKEISCYKCLEDNHIATSCTNSIKCRNCLGPHLCSSDLCPVLVNWSVNDKKNKFIIDFLLGEGIISHPIDAFSSKIRITRDEYESFECGRSDEKSEELFKIVSQVMTIINPLIDNQNII